MTAAEARLRAFNANQKKDCEREIRIRVATNRLLNKIQEVANEGGSQTLYAIDGLRCFTEHCEVRDRLTKLGYSFAKETDNGLEYEMVMW